MKPKLIIAAILLIALSTMGFQCINDGFEITLNLDPFNGCFFVNAGTSHDFSGDPVRIDSKTLYDNSYELTGVGVYDIQVQTMGTDLGAITNGVVYVWIEGSPVPPDTLATYAGNWSDFTTPRSILTSPTLVKVKSAGITRLVQAVMAKQVVVLRGQGHVQTIPPTSRESQVCVKAFAQAVGTP
ncbi:MAG TPA: hypothetical protein DGH68_05600 [Bacteroidetes bacterium]|jgi:hypothetical protein|nr:hypothetical protein [Bacteroidota bacterium]